SVGTASQPSASGGSSSSGCRQPAARGVLDFAGVVGGRLYQCPQPGTVVLRARPLLTARLRAADPVRGGQGTGGAEPARYRAGRRQGGVSFGSAVAPRVGTMGVTPAQPLQVTSGLSELLRPGSREDSSRRSVSGATGLTRW